MKTIIGTAEKYRRKNEKRAPRNEVGLTKRQQAKRDRVKEIKSLYAKGMTQLEIAKTLGINQGTVSRHLVC